MTKAEWQSIRPDELKKHGLGKALEAYKKACTPPKAMKVYKQYELAKEAAEDLEKVATKAHKQAPKGHDVGLLLKDYIVAAKTYLKNLEAEVKRRRSKFETLKLEEIMRSSVLYAFFYAHAKKEYSDENVDFLAAIDKNQSKEKIYNTYVKKSAKRQVNLPGKILKALGDGADDFTDYASLDFRDAYQDVWKMVKKDTLSRFTSQKFEECFGVM